MDFRSKTFFAVFGWYFTPWIRIQEAKILRIRRIRILSIAWNLDVEDSVVFKIKSGSFR